MFVDQLRCCKACVASAHDRILIARENHNGANTVCHHFASDSFNKGNTNVTTPVIKDAITFHGPKGTALESVFSPALAETSPDETVDSLVLLLQYHVQTKGKLTSNEENAQKQCMMTA
jgi:hypothetical protein